MATAKAKPKSAAVKAKPKSGAKAKAKPKGKTSTKSESGTLETAKAKPKPKSKTATKSASASGAAEMVAEVAEVAKKSKVAGKDSKKTNAKERTSKTAVEHEPQLAAATETDAEKMKLEALNIEDVPTPWPWFSNKRKLLEQFPKDTLHRFKSRCYHRTLDSCKRSGMKDDMAKLFAGAAHEKGRKQWLLFFPAEEN